jgi:hypothetical protein
MKSKKILILMACLAVLLAGCRLGLGKNKAEKSVKPEIKNEPVMNSIATSSEKIATSTAENVVESQKYANLDPGNWKTYSDSIHGFELKIPSKDVFVGAYTLDEIKVIQEKETKRHLAEGGMMPGYLFPEMNDGRANNDVEAWELGEKIYKNKDSYINNLFYVRCKKDKALFDSCFFLSQEGGASVYEKILYHKGVRISISIILPNNRFEDILLSDKGEKRFKDMSNLLNAYINDSFTERERIYVDTMDKIVASLKFTK